MNYNFQRGIPAEKSEWFTLMWKEVILFGPKLIFLKKILWQYYFSDHPKKDAEKLSDCDMVTLRKGSIKVGLIVNARHI